MENMWAVVTFLEECNGEEFTSEVPVNWLVGTTKCFWPNTKNVNSLMSKKVDPDINSPKWTLYSIRVECYSESQKSARKKAASVSTSDEGGRGRGLRIKKKSLKRTEDANLESSYSSEESFDKSNLPSFPITSQNQVSIDDIPDMPINIVDNIEIINMASPASDSIQTSSAADYVGIIGELKTFLTDEFKTVVRQLREVNLNLVDFHQRLEKIEANLKGSRGTLKHEDVQDMLNLFPFNSWEDIWAFEELLNTDHTKRTNLKKYLINVGGTNTKDNIVRILKRIFSNSFAVECSWLGQRNNFKVSSLKTLVETIKAAVAENYPHNDKEFENVCGEWLRQAKLRLTREKKKKAKTN